MLATPDWFAIFNETSAFVPSALLEDVAAGPGDAQRVAEAIGACKTPEMDKIDQLMRTELVLLHRIIWRSASQHRSSAHMRHMRMLLAACKRACPSSMPEEISAARRMAKPGGTTVPPQQLIDLVCARTVASAVFCRRAMRASDRAYRSLGDQLKRTYFMPLALTVMCLASRTYALLQAKMRLLAAAHVRVAAVRGSVASLASSDERVSLIGMRGWPSGFADCVAEVEWIAGGEREAVLWEVEATLRGDEVGGDVARGGMRSGLDHGGENGEEDEGLALLSRNAVNDGRLSEDAGTGIKDAQVGAGDDDDDGDDHCDDGDRIVRSVESDSEHESTAAAAAPATVAAPEVPGGQTRKGETWGGKGSSSFSSPFAQAQPPIPSSGATPSSPFAPDHATSRSRLAEACAAPFQTSSSKSSLTTSGQGKKRVPSDGQGALLAKRKEPEKALPSSGAGGNQAPMKKKTKKKDGVAPLRGMAVDEEEGGGGDRIADLLFGGAGHVKGDKAARAHGMPPLAAAKGVRSAAAANASSLPQAGKKGKKKGTLNQGAGAAASKQKAQGKDKKGGVASLFQSLLPKGDSDW